MAMVNEEKVKLMTKLAIYENTKGKKQLNISKYYKRDYVRFQMFKTAVSSTIAFMILLFAYCMLNAEQLLLKLNDLDFLSVAAKVGVLYVVFLVIYMLAAWVVYANKYEKIKPDVVMYNRNLKRLKEMYDREEKEMKEKRAGRSVTTGNDNVDQY